MKRFLFAVPFVIGAIAVVWIAATFMRHPVALAVTLIIAAVYAMGFAELLRFRRNTARLDQRLDDLPDSRDSLRHWLQSLPASLRHAVQRRIDGHPAPLPGPVLTPYLTGLLVMLGLLGTFVGMIVTLQGAATALDGSSELSAIRSALSAPIAGLSLAFGTSIAGVAASAMLGLTATLCRRDRLLVSRKLDRLTDTTLHAFSLDHQREAAYQALHQQAESFPALVNALQGLAGSLKGKLILIAGGDAKGADLSELAPVLSAYVDVVIALGKDGRVLSDIAAHGFYVESLEQAVQQAFSLAEPGDTVLLSPACASLDMFKNYQHRAEVFQQAVEELSA